MAEEQNSSLQEKRENPMLSFFTNLFAAIKLPFPIPQKKNNNSEKIEAADGSSPQADFTVTVNPPASVIEGEIAVVKPVVTFPKKSENVPPLKLEAEADGAERSTNPVLLWQVYAIGAFFVLRWGWSRWNERKGQKKPDDGPPPGED